MSKVSFRARQIDFNKPLPILKNGSDILPEFNENALVNRGVPQIPSGMEKEEENEHHFVEVIQALQFRTDASLKIPVPDVVDRSVVYKKIYPNSFSLPKRYVHFGAVFLSEEQPVDYDMDTEDEEWLSKSELDISPEKFESMMDTLERGCGQKVMNLEEAKYLLQDDHSLVIAVYDYWLHKRVQCRQPLLYSVRQERRDNTNNADPYVAFRRRSEKMQTRKNRKNDEQSYEKMLMLRDQMESLGEILSQVVTREAVKEALVQCNHRRFETRYHMNDWEGSYLTEADNLARKTIRENADGFQTSKETPRKRPSRKRKLSQRVYGIPEHNQTPKESVAGACESDPDGPFTFIRTQGCRYLKPRSLIGASSSPQQDPQTSHPRYQLTTVPAVCHPDQHIYTGYVRRRLGRGGRVICDRLPLPPERASYLSAYDNRLQSSANITSNVPQSSMHFSTQQFKPKDEYLLQRLRAVTMNSNRCQPSFQWPICTESPAVPCFEPLHHDPWRLTRIQSDLDSCTSVSSTVQDTAPSLNAPPDKGGETANSSPDDPGCEKFPADNQLDRLEREGQDSPNDDTNNIGRAEVKKTKSSSTSAPANLPPAVLPVTDAGNSAPHRLWRRKLTRPFGGPNDASPDLSRSRGVDAPISGSNGLGPRLLPAPDDRLMLPDTVLPASKVCCMPRDCVPRDSNVSGPQLQTANGVNPTQFCQLPI